MVSRPQSTGETHGYPNCSCFCLSDDLLKAFGYHHDAQRQVTNFPVIIHSSSHFRFLRREQPFQTLPNKSDLFSILLKASYYSLRPLAASLMGVPRKLYSSRM